VTIPEFIIIGDIRYNVHFVDRIDDDDSCGESCRVTNTIKICSKLSDENKELTFWHEVLHLINGELEESEVDMLAVLIHQVIKQTEVK
jgi:hypothetical protein